MLPVCMNSFLFQKAHTRELKFAQTAEFEVWYIYEEHKVQVIDCEKHIFSGRPAQDVALLGKSVWKPRSLIPEPKLLSFA